MRLQLTVLFLAVLAVSSALCAQTTGTITVSGTTPIAISMTNSNNGTTAVSTTMSFTTLTPTTGGTLNAPTPVVLYLRSNTNYKLTAVTSTPFAITGGASANGGADITASDVGFGITAITPSTDATNVVTRSDTIAAGFNYQTLPTVTNGLITFTSGTFNSLSDIASSTSILTGNRISNKGNMSTNNNYLAVSIGVFTLPQFFTPNSTFGATITLTLVNT